jgi:hypothetical protein
LLEAAATTFFYTTIESTITKMITNYYHRYLGTIGVSTDTHAQQYSVSGCRGKEYFRKLIDCRFLGGEGCIFLFTLV